MATGATTSAATAGCQRGGGGGGGVKEERRRRRPEQRAEGEECAPRPVGAHRSCARVHAVGADMARAGVPDPMSIIMALDKFSFYFKPTVPNSAVGTASARKDRSV